MKMFLISDNMDTYNGMRLSGIDGVVVHNPNEIEQAFKKATSDRDIGLILVTEKIAVLRKDLVDYHKLNGKMPLLVEVPDRHSTSRVKESIATYVKNAIGINI